MKLAIYRGEEDILVLVRRLYKFQGHQTERKAQAAKEHLLKHNPHLHDLSQARRGAPIVVPEVQGVEASEDTFSIGHGASGKLLRMRLALTSIRGALEASVGRRAAEAGQTLQRLKSREFKALAKKSPRFAERLPEVAAHARAQIDQAPSVRSAQSRALDKLERDLDLFLQRIA